MHGEAIAIQRQSQIESRLQVHPELGRLPAALADEGRTLGRNRRLRTTRGCASGMEAQPGDAFGVLPALGGFDCVWKRVGGPVGKDMAGAYPGGAGLKNCDRSWG